MNFFTKLKVPLTLFFISSIITMIVFRHKIDGFTSYMPLPDVDFEGTMWVSWYFSFLQSKNLSPLLSDYFSYPYTLDYSDFIVGNLTTDIIQFILQIVGPNLSNTILITNILSFLTYPLSVVTAYFLARVIGCNISFSFIASLAYAFSYNHIMDGRGIMVLGQHWLIPLSLAQSIRFCNKTSFKNTIALGFILGIQLGFDGYYGFYSIAATCLISLTLLGHHFQLDWKKAAQKTALYFTFIMLIIATMNLQFITANISFLLFKSDRDSISRDIPFTEHLQPLENFFLPSSQSFQAEFLRHLGFSDFPGASLLSYTLFISSILGFFIFRKMTLQNKKLYLASFIGILSILSVATDWKYGTPLRKFYFDYFSVFRSVGRLSHYYTLFLAIMASISYSELSLLKPHFFQKLSFQIPATLLLSILIITEGLNHDPSWQKRFDLQKAYPVFQPLRDDPEIKRIISLPNVFKKYNMIPTQQIAQMIHNKPISVGTSPSSLFQHQFRKEEGLNPGVLNRIIKMGIDTIVIYNYYHHNQYPIHPHEMLIVDPRVHFKGHYFHHHEEDTIPSHLERSLDISVYKIAKKFLPHSSLNHRAQFKNTGFSTRSLHIRDNIATLHFPYTGNIQLFSLLRPWEIFTNPYQANLPTDNYDFNMNWNLPEGDSYQWSVIHTPTFIRFISMWLSRIITLYFLYLMLSHTSAPIPRIFKEHFSH
ncbi:MAG: hypothetical protein AB8C84_09775 [Oligoflexales bacterium]